MNKEKQHNPVGQEGMPKRSRKLLKAWIILGVHAFLVYVVLQVDNGPKVSSGLTIFQEWVINLFWIYLAGLFLYTIYAQFRKQTGKTSTAMLKIILSVIFWVLVGGVISLFTSFIGPGALVLLLPGGGLYWLLFILLWGKNNSKN